MANLRKLVAWLGTLGVLGLALLPAEHVHARTGHGHHTEVVHRHFQPHHTVGEAARFDDDDHDGEALYLTAVFTAPSIASVVHLTGALFVAPVPLLKPPQLSGSALPSPDAPGHDPPGTSSHGLRAPPIPLV